MRVRWTTDAADDLERICDYIAQDSPGAAQRVAESVEFFTAPSDGRKRSPVTAARARVELQPADGLAVGPIN